MFGLGILDELNIQYENDKVFSRLLHLSDGQISILKDILESKDKSNLLYLMQKYITMVYSLAFGEKSVSMQVNEQNCHKALDIISNALKTHSCTIEKLSNFKN